MKATIITIGDEILIGQIVDTNSAWIAWRLNEAGIRVRETISVADDEDAIADAVSAALESSGLVITTGGLGPTKDDITKKTLAGLFGCGMAEDRATYQRNERTMKARGIEYNELNRSQAMVPECCDALPNHNGTAPGMWFERSSGVLVCLPGVPYEMRHLMTGEVMPRLRKRFELADITHRTALVFGIAESMLAERIAVWEDSLPHYLRLAYLPGPSGIRLRLSSYGGESAAVLPEIERQFASLRELIPEFVVGFGETSIEAAVADILTGRGMTLAVAESCTGGAISSRFTAMPGASEYFLCGVVAYDNNVKTGVLGVSADDIRREGAVSRTVAEQMAAGVRRISGADCAIATTGVAGPSGGTERDPVGTVWVAAAHPEGVVSHRFSFGRLREQNIERAAASAINMLRLLLSDPRS